MTDAPGLVQANLQGLQIQPWRSWRGSWEIVVTKTEAWEICGLRQGEGEEGWLEGGGRKSRQKEWSMACSLGYRWDILAGGGVRTHNLACQGHCPKGRKAPIQQSTCRCFHETLTSVPSLRISLPGVCWREKLLTGKLLFILDCIHFLSSIWKVKVKLRRSLAEETSSACMICIILVYSIRGSFYVPYGTVTGFLNNTFYWLDGFFFFLRSIIFCFQDIYSRTVEI